MDAMELIIRNRKTMARLSAMDRDDIAEEIHRLEDDRDRLLEALTMVRDAHDDCKADGLPTIPDAARAKIDAAITKTEAR